MRHHPSSHRPIPPEKIGIEQVLDRTGLTEEGLEIALTFGFPSSSSGRAWNPGEVDTWIARLDAMLERRRG